MTRDRAERLLREIPTEEALGVAAAREDVRNGTADQYVALDLEAIFGERWAGAYRRYVAAARDLAELEAIR